MEKKSYKSWTISDAFWEAIKDEIPERQRSAEKTYQRKPGGGRKPLDKRQVLEGIFYVLRTGCQWKAVPKEYGAGSSIHQYFQEWEAAGFFEKIWAKGLEQYDELEGIGWEWQSLDHLYGDPEHSGHVADADLGEAFCSESRLGRVPEDSGAKM